MGGITIRQPQVLTCYLRLYARDTTCSTLSFLITWVGRTLYQRTIYVDHGRVLGRPYVLTCGSAGVEFMSSPYCSWFTLHRGRFSSSPPAERCTFCRAVGVSARLQGLMFTHLGLRCVPALAPLGKPVEIRHFNNHRQTVGHQAGLFPLLQLRVLRFGFS